MRDKDMAVLAKVRDALVQYLPKEESPLLTEYLAVYEHLQGKHQKQKENYQKNAAYYREMSKQWKLEHPGQHKRHMEEHLSRKKRKKENKMDNMGIPAKLIRKETCVSDLVDRTFYYTKEMFFEDTALFLRIGSYILTAPGTCDADGTVRIRADRGKYRCFAIRVDKVKDMKLIDAQLVMIYFEKRETMNGLPGVRTDYGHVTLAFMDSAPDRFLLRAEPLLKILAASNAAGKSFIFSIATLDGKDIEAVETVVPGTVVNEDDLSCVDDFRDLVESVPELEYVEVHASAYIIGGGETEQLPQELCDEIDRYGIDDFVALDHVTPLEDNRFTACCENFR